MRTFLGAAAALLLSAALSAEEAAPPAPASSSPAQPAPAAEQPKPALEQPKSEAKPEAKPAEVKAAEQPKPEAKPAEAKAAEQPKPEAKPAEAKAAEPAKPQAAAKVTEAPKAEPAAPAVQDPAAEWKFLKSNGDDARPEVAEAVLSQTIRLLRANPDADFADEAQLLRSNLHMRLGDYKAAAMDLLALIYENPDSKLDFQAKRSLADIVDKKMERKLKPVLSDIARAPDIKDKPSRAAALLKRVVDQTGDSLYEPAAAEFEHFFLRYPSYPKTDELLVLEGQLHAKKGKYQAAILSYNKLLAIYPKSALRPQAQRLIGDVLAQNLRDYNKAIDAYQEVTSHYADSPEAGLAYEQIARLEEQMKQYDLAVDVYEKIVKLYPTSDSALRAFNAEARLLGDYLGRPADAIKAYGRLADMFKGTPPAAKALKAAAQLAHKQKDYTTELALDQRLAKECPDAPEAPEALYAAAELCEDELTDPQKAVEIYNSVSSQFPKHKLSKKAKNRAASLAKKIGESASAK